MHPLLGMSTSIIGLKCSLLSAVKDFFPLCSVASESSVRFESVNILSPTTFH